ncbi:MAG: pro-sigmaK processing inhibitor BofA family protein [Bacilli bacterium]|nr:pro-sigmaK processing inhibitor BofA family protein [Bacilli bacterium]
MIVIKLFKNIIKRIICSAFLIYGYNLISVNFSLMLPINIISLSFVSLFGSIGLFVLVLFKYLIL